MATQDMVDFHCDLLERCLNGGDEPSEGEDDEEEGLEDNPEVTDDAKAVMQANKISLGKRDKGKKSSRVSQPKINLHKLHGSMKQKDRLEVSHFSFVISYTLRILHSY